MQYFHRNTATEILGLVFGEYGGRSDGFAPGALSYETGFCPHGGECRREHAMLCVAERRIASGQQRVHRCD